MALDLTAIPYVASPFLGEIIATIKLVQDAGSRIAVVTGPRRIMEDPTLRHRLFQQFERLGEALAFLNAPLDDPS